MAIETKLDHDLEPHPGDVELFEDSYPKQGAYLAQRISKAPMMQWIFVSGDDKCWVRDYDVLAGEDRTL